MVQTLPDLRKSLRQHHRVGGKLRPVESGGVGHQGRGGRKEGERIRGHLGWQWKQFHVAGGVTPALQPSGDGRHPQIQIGNQRIQQAALAGP
jgi:hypothetical protein